MMQLEHLKVLSHFVVLSHSLASPLRLLLKVIYAVFNLAQQYLGVTKREKKTDKETRYNNFNIDPLLMIQNPVRVKTKRRSSGASNKKKTA